MNVQQQDGQDDQPRQTWIITELRVILLWLITLIWILLAAAIQHDAGFAMLGITIELIATTSCIHLTRYMRRDHNRLTRRLEHSIVPIADVQPVIDTANTFRAGWIAHELEQDRTGTGPCDDNVIRLDRRRPPDHLERQIRAMRRPIAPVPQPRPAEAGSPDESANWP